MDIQEQLILAEKNNNYLLDKIELNYNKIEQFKEIIIEIDKIIKNKIIFYSQKLNEYSELKLEFNQFIMLK